MYTLQAFKEDTLASDITDSATSMTLSTGAFGTPTGEQMFVIDYDVSNKREIIKAAVDGTAVTSIDRAQDGTAAVAHSSGAKVIMAFTPSHYADVTSNGVIGYAEATADQGSITTEADLTNLAVTVTVPAGGRKVRVSAFINAYGSQAGFFILKIKEGTTQLQACEAALPASTRDVGIATSVILTPAAGSHTYKLTGTAVTSTNTVYAGATYPSYILVEYLGGV
jgi:hypothetical protein